MAAYYLLTEDGKTATVPGLLAKKVLEHMQMSEKDEFLPNRIALDLELTPEQMTQAFGQLEGAGYIFKKEDEEPVF